MSGGGKESANAATGRSSYVPIEQVRPAAAGPPARADRRTGACPAGFVAIPQLRVTISYDIPRDVQARGQYALDSFPEENHNPFSDQDDFVNVNSTCTMKRIVSCLNRGAACR